LQYATGLTVKMLKTMNAMGIFKNDDIWFPTYYTYNTIWNFSDASEKLAKVKDIGNHFHFFMLLLLAGVRITTRQLAKCE
jgi:hypothetical protein